MGCVASKKTGTKMVDTQEPVPAKDSKTLLSDAPVDANQTTKDEETVVPTKVAEEKAVEDSQATPVVEEKKEDTVAVEKNVESVVEEKKVEAVVEEKEQPVVEEKKEETVVEEKKVESVVEEKKEEAVVEAKKEETVVDEKKEEAATEEKKDEIVGVVNLEVKDVTENDGPVLCQCIGPFGN